MRHLHEDPGRPGRPPLYAPAAFYSLIVSVRPDIICDVGSCDGSAALRFKSLLPRARVVAFEANGANYARMVSNEALVRRGIAVRHAAVTDVTGPVTFYEVDVPRGDIEAPGISSLHRRGPDIVRDYVERPVTVPGLRLGGALSDMPRGDVGLWIDVEGAAEEVIRGLGDAATRVAFIQIETEPTPLWVGQAGEETVVGQLRELGFEVIVSEPGLDIDTAQQRNLVLLSRQVRHFDRHAAMARLAASWYPRLRRLGRRR